MIWILFEFCLRRQALDILPLATAKGQGESDGGEAGAFCYYNSEEHHTSENVNTCSEVGAFGCEEDGVMHRSHAKAKLMAGLLGFNLRALRASHVLLMQWG